MANNYLLFSFAIPLDTREAAEWAEEAVAFLTNTEALLDYIEAVHSTNESPSEFDALVPDGFLDTEDLGYSVEVDEDGIWFYTEESGTPDNVVPFVQAFLLKFDPRGCVAFEWADTCSKPRLDEFGGGAVFITATGVQYMNTGTWVAQRISEHEKATK